MKQRIFVHQEGKAIMSFSRQLRCWCVDFVTSKGVLNKGKKPAYGFHNSRSSAITIIRKEVKIPVDGWVKIWINTRKMSIAEVAQEAWKSVV